MNQIFTIIQIIKLEIIFYHVKTKYNTRWVGSMVSDCHRTLIGIFMYPPINVK